MYAPYCSLALSYDMPLTWRVGVGILLPTHGPGSIFTRTHTYGKETSWAERARLKSAVCAKRLLFPFCTPKKQQRQLWQQRVLGSRRRAPRPTAPRLTAVVDNTTLGPAPLPPPTPPARSMYLAFWSNRLACSSSCVFFPNVRKGRVVDLPLSPLSDLRYGPRAQRPPRPRIRRHANCLHQRVLVVLLWRRAPSSISLCMSLQETSEEVEDPRFRTPNIFFFWNRGGFHKVAGVFAHGLMISERTQHSSSGRGQTRASITCTCRQHQHLEESEEVLRSLLTVQSGGQRASPNRLTHTG